MPTKFVVTRWMCDFCPTVFDGEQDCFLHERREHRVLSMTDNLLYLRCINRQVKSGLQVEDMSDLDELERELGDLVANVRHVRRAVNNSSTALPLGRTFGNSHGGHNHGHLQRSEHGREEEEFNTGDFMHKNSGAMNGASNEEEPVASTDGFSVFDNLTSSHMGDGIRIEPDEQGDAMPADEHYDEPVDCTVCGKTIHQARNLAAHMLTHSTLRCDVCGRKFTSAVQFAAHKKTAHRAVHHQLQQHRRELNRVSMVTPSSLVAKPAISAAAQSRHSLPSTSKVNGKKRTADTTTGEEVACHMCGKVLQYRRNLAYHLEMVHKVHLRNIECDKCGNMFRTRLGLAKHTMAVHTARDGMNTQ